MCGSDLPPYRAAHDAFRPIIRGHEPCGVIAARGSGVTEDEAPIGQRVMIHHYSGCGQCKYCRVGYAQLCVEGGHKVYGANANGGHGDYILVKPHMLVPLPDELSVEEGAAISCGTGTAFDALRRLDVSGRDTLAVFGQGPVGLSATLAKSFGADETLNARDVDAVAAIRELTHGEGATTTLDCTGQPDARVNAVKSACMWGRVCFVGEGNTVTLDVSPDVIHKQLTIYGSWTFSSVGQAECARFIVDHGIDLSRLLTHRFSLDQAEEAYKLFDTQTTGKGVFVR
jgi:threonine dehydrogenase-like Zn-dependent dehydrogenase